MSKYLCFVEGQGEEWEAICYDFDLAVHGSSMEDVIKQISEAIFLYLDYVESLPEEEQEAFLNRRAPWRLKLIWKLHAIRNVFFIGSSRSVGGYANYTVSEDSIRRLGDGGVGTSIANASPA